MAEDETGKRDSHSTKRKRSAKISMGQYNIYLEELQHNEMFRTNKFNPKQLDILEETWNSLTKKLNAAGGPIKTVQQWKERFADWKCNVRKKARKLELSRVRTGGGPPEIPMSEIEERLLDLTGRAVINGVKEIPELGIEENPPAPAVTPVRPPTPQATPEETNITTPKAKNIKLSSSNKQQHKRPTLASSVRTLVEQDMSTTNYLQEISETLKTLVELKRKELLIAKIQLKLNFPDREFQFQEDNDFE